MEDFFKLGDRLEAEWRAKDYDETIFPALAADGLAGACLPDRYNAWQVLEWTLEQTELPKQRDLPGRFGEPPITIYSGPRFHIDVYFWFHGTTSTHQHSFCGAFQVMRGSSIHSWYDFEPTDNVNSFCEIGKMILRSCKLLNVGDIQEILPGRQYIHSLFHLDQPSATIVVRADKSPLFLPQYDYHKPGLAVDPFFEPESTVKKLQTIGALLRAQRPDADELISKLLEQSDFHTTFIILSHVYGYLTPNGIEQMFGAAESQKRFDVMLRTAENKHPGRGDIFGKVFSHRRQLDDIVRRRSIIDDPELRFFFALLLNVDGRKLILELIHDRFPDVDPIEKVLDWSYELSQRRISGPQNQNALGIAPFDDFDLTLLEHLLRGKADGEMADVVREIYPAEKAEQLLPTLSDRTAAIRASAVFSPLLHGD